MFSGFFTKNRISSQQNETFNYVAIVCLIFVTSTIATFPTSPRPFLTSPRPFPQNPPLIPGCPIIEEDPSNSCFPSCYYNGIYSCKPEETCCLNECGFAYCDDTAVYIEECPYYYAGPCHESCVDNDTGLSYCEYPSYCCESPYCGFFCENPLLVSGCLDTPDLNKCFPDCRDSYGNYICTNGEICCTGPCGETCLKPDYYRVLCPNESILEASDPKQRLTSFCIDDCDCDDFGQICCESPCGCELDICRNPVIQKAECPDSCTYDYWNSCSSDVDCYKFGQICCDNCGGYPICQDPIFVDGPDYLWEIGIPENP